MIHSLNALRVMAEFVVVRGHLALFVEPPEDVAKATFAVITSHDLMSFFFVLSGYVSMHNACSHDPWNDLGAYYRRKLARYYPLYVVALTLTLTMGGQFTLPHESCSFRWLCLIGDYLLLSPWCLCSALDGAGVTWYLQTLFWLWFAFPFLCRFRSTWQMLGLTYLVSLLGWLAPAVLWVGDLALGDNWHSLHRIPLLRLAEFSMGCQIYTLERPSPRTVVAMAAAYASMLAAGAWASQGYTLCTSRPLSSRCWPFDPPPAEGLEYSCEHWWDMVQSRASLPFAVLIRYVAELEGTWLDHQIFKDVNRFSLHVYLLHDCIGRLFWILCGGPGTFALDSVILVAYLGSYAAYSLQARWQRKPPIEVAEEMTALIA